MSIVSLPCLIVKHNLGLKTIHQLFQSQKIPQATKQHSGKTKIRVNSQFQYFSCSENIPKFEIWCRFLDSVEPEENRNTDTGPDSDTDTVGDTNTDLNLLRSVFVFIKTCNKNCPLLSHKYIQNLPKFPSSTLSLHPSMSQSK